MAAVEISPQSLAQLTLEDSEVARKLGRQIEIPMVHGPDLYPKPSSGDRAFRGTEPRHAVRQSDLREPGIARQFSPEKADKVVASLFALFGDRLSHRSGLYGTAPASGGGPDPN